MNPGILPTRNHIQKWKQLSNSNPRRQMSKNLHKLNQNLHNWIPLKMIEIFLLLPHFNTFLILIKASLPVSSGSTICKTNLELKRETAVTAQLSTLHTLKKKHTHTHNKTSVWDLDGDTYYREHTHTGPLSTCRCQGMDQERHQSQWQPHTAYGCCT